MSVKRFSVLDNIRGFALLNMIIYHVIWNLVYLFDFDWRWFESDSVYLWQQGICWTFIFLSGFCQSLSRHKLKRGITVFLAGVLISLVKALTIPQDRIMFGVLTLIGSCMLLMIPLDHILKRCKPLIGLIVSMLLFVTTRNINDGFLGFENWNLYKLPSNWYHNLTTTYLGFPMYSFSSSDYFSLFPWIFLFIAGYFLFQLMKQKQVLHYLEADGIKALEWIGRHSLIIYLVHQPILYLIFFLILMK